MEFSHREISNSEFHFAFAFAANSFLFSLVFNRCLVGIFFFAVDGIHLRTITDRVRVYFCRSPMWIVLSSETMTTKRVVPMIVRASWRSSKPLNQDAVIQSELNSEETRDRRSYGDRENLRSSLDTFFTYARNNARLANCRTKLSLNDFHQFLAALKIRHE